MPAARPSALIFDPKAVILCLLCLISSLFGENANKPPRLAIIPLANRTANNAALERATADVTSKIAPLGYELVDKDSLRNQMRLSRLRLTGAIDSASAELIRGSLQVDLVVTGALELFAEEENPEVGICLRVYDCRTHEITWIGCEFATGEDFAGLFGLGRLTDIAAVSTRVIDRLISRMPSGLPDDRRAERKPDKLDKRLMAAGHIAVIPFDHSTETPNVDGIATDLLMQELWQRGFDLVEPGELIRLQSLLNVEIHGGISQVALSALREKYELSALVTGSITAFEPARSAASEIVPRLELSLRLTDPASGSIAAAVSLEHTGAEWETLFGLGRINSIGKLEQRSLQIGWKELLRAQQDRAKAVAAKTDSTGATNASR